MEPLGELLGRVESTKTEARSRITQETEQLTEQLKQAQSSIVNGSETTGSLLHDGLIVLYGENLVSMPQIVGNYERVAEEIESRKGQPFITINHYFEYHGCTGFGGKQQEVTVTSIDMGILRGAQLDFDYDKQTCAIPTARHAHIDDKNFRSVPSIVKGKLMVSMGLRGWLSTHFDLGTDLDREITIDETNRFIGPEKMRALTVIIGKDGIADWLTKADNDRRTAEELREVRKLCFTLNINPIKPVSPIQKAVVSNWKDF